MEINEIFKKMMDATLGMVSATAEKVAEFTENMSQKGQQFKETKKEEFEKFIGQLKSKLEESTQSVMNALQLKNKKLEALEKEVQELKKEVEFLKNQVARSK